MALQLWMVNRCAHLGLTGMSVGSTMPPALVIVFDRRIFECSLASNTWSAGSAGDEDAHGCSLGRLLEPGKGTCLFWVIVQNLQRLTRLAPLQF